LGGRVDKLVLEHVFKNYGSVQAVKDISFSIKPKEFITIVGPSGCGKSSTLRMIAGIESITNGDMMLDGKRINDISARDRNIALAFESYALYPHMTVSGNLSFPLEAARLKKDEIRRKVDATLILLNLEKFKNKKPGELSGGQQQRVSLGRALIREASVYLLDEPLSHLDAQERVDLRTQLQRIQKLNELTFVLVTHDQLEALALSDRIIVMNNGEIQQIGTPEELYDNPANLFVADFIGEPPMNFISGKLIKEDNIYVQKCEKTEFILSGKGKKLDNYLNNETILGIRPQYIHVGDKAENNKNNIKGKVFSYEYLGDSGLLILSFENINILIELEHDKNYQIGDVVSFSFDDEYVCLFDKNSGARII
jgi:multiple sugar transport system ATP-binding protein